MTKSQVLEFFKILEERNADPKTELAFTNPYTLLVAVVLSAQATDVGVNKATKALFEKVSTPQDMLDLGLEGLKEHVKTVGLYPTKTRHIIALSEKLVQLYDGVVPHSRTALESLPGVGRKTANVVLNVAFGEDVIAVDTHVFRVSNRTGLAPGKTPLEVEKALEMRIMPLLPKAWRAHLHHWLILHGRYICKAQRPLCRTCPVQHLCVFPDKNL